MSWRVVIDYYDCPFLESFEYTDDICKVEGFYGKSKVCNKENCPIKVK